MVLTRSLENFKRNSFNIPFKNLRRTSLGNTTWNRPIERAPSKELSLGGKGAWLWMIMRGRFEWKECVFCFWKPLLQRVPGFHDSFARWVFAGVFLSLFFLKPSENRLFNLPSVSGLWVSQVGLYESHGSTRGFPPHLLIFSSTADGSEIRRSPVEVGSFSHYLEGFIHPRWWSHDFWTINSSTAIPTAKTLGVLFM